MKGNQSLLSFVEYILNVIEKKNSPKSINVQKLENELNFYSFEDDVIFYSKILSHLINVNEKDKIYTNLARSTESFKRNLFIFLMYLKQLINSKKFEKLYQDPIVKLDISLLIRYLVNKYGAGIVESIEFFPLCIKELEKKYKAKEIIDTKYDIELKKRARIELEVLEYRKKQHFDILLKYLKEYYINQKNYSQEDRETIDNISNEYEKLNLSMNEIEKNYLNNNSFQKYMELYLEKELLINGYNKENYKEGKSKELYEKKKKQIKNHLFYSDILKINLNDIDDCVYLLNFMSTLYKDEPFFDLDEEFKNLQSRKKVNDFTKDLKVIIEDESFINDLKEILNQESVKYYFENVIKENFLKNGFERFMNYIKKDECFFSILFIFKYLPKYRRAFVDPNMRIVIYPIYFELSESLDKNKINEIFRAYLFIIILNEIAHLVKFMKAEKDPYDIQKTPKKKEGEKTLINYLFHLPIIYYITYEQSSIINKPKNWNNTALLSSIFKEQKEWYEKNEKEKNGNITKPFFKEKDFISFILSLVDYDNDDEANSNAIIDDWYDID